MDSAQLHNNAIIIIGLEWSSSICDVKLIFRVCLNSLNYFVTENGRNPNLGCDPLFADPSIRQTCCTSNSSLSEVASVNVAS